MASMASNPDSGPSKVVVNRAMSLDGFIAGPDHAMEWIFEYLKDDAFPEVMRATGAMLVGRGTYEVAKRMPDEDTDYDGGPVFVLTHRPPDEPEQGATFLSCDLAEAVATARRGREEPGDPRRRPGQPVPAARARRRGPGVRPAGAARRRCALLDLGPGPDRPGAVQQPAVRSGDDAPLPRADGGPAAERVILQARA